MIFDPALIAHMASKPIAAELRNVDDFAEINPPSSYHSHFYREVAFDREYSLVVLKSVLKDISRSFFDARQRELLAATEHESSISAITRHEKFGEIVAMRDAAVRLILEDIKNGIVHLYAFPALKRITNSDPVAPEHRGYLPEMANAWVRWGEQSGKI